MLLNTLYFSIFLSLVLFLVNLLNLIQLPEEGFKNRKSFHLAFQLFGDNLLIKDQSPDYINNLSYLMLKEYYLNNWLIICLHFSYAGDCNSHFYAAMS